MQPPPGRVHLNWQYAGRTIGGRRVADSPFRLLGKPYSFRELAQAVRTALDNDEDRAEFTLMRSAPSPSPG